MNKLFLILILLFSFQALGRSCEKNQTCKKRFQIQDDPIDFERESSRAHIVTFFTLNTLSMRFLDKYYPSLTKNEKKLTSVLFWTSTGLIKELVYDPDGLSRSDFVNNSLGIGLSLVFELSFF